MHLWCGQMSVRMDWNIWLSLCWMFIVAEGCILLNTTKMEVTKSAGESALLPCSCTVLSAKPKTFRWLRDGMEISPSKLGAYSGRIQMFGWDSPGNLSMFITDLTRTDQGSYRCESKSSRDIFLRIEGCTLTENNTPLEITGSPGESVLLPCSCSPLQVIPERVEWEFRKGESLNDPATKVSNTSRPYRGRVQMFHHLSRGNASLLISNLSERDQGFYVCYVDKNQKKFHLLVKVINSSGDGESGIPQYVFVLVAVLLLLLLLGGVKCLRHKGQESECTISGWLHEMEKKDDVTYSTVVFSRTPRAVEVEMENDNSTEYARIKIL